ncbi:hypothetical protein [uncultured Pseudoteredinibacter sp.]|uniref:hypothetical protein n=1 Tax=uncultured Pseudoteredinibacter sp. TaxID=1641701 RepID=UPI002616C167|nr:hypothetical protein [uncultured Pseudoteredinibacter sp.]
MKSSKKQLKKKQASRTKRRLTVLLFLALNIIPILMVGLYLIKTPIFQSKMSILLPGKGSNSNVKLENVGQVSSSSSSPFSQQFNPRANYKSILESRDVAEKVKRQLNLAEAPARPKVKLLQQTSIIELDIRSVNADHSQELAWAYFSALQERLSELREDELKRRQQSTRKALSVQLSTLNDSRLKLLSFQQQSLLLDKKMMSDHLALISDTRSKKSSLSAEIKRLEYEVDRLSKDLGISPYIAAKALNLQSDIRFNVYLEELAIINVKYNEHRAKFAKNHPEMRKVQQRYSTARANIRKRSEEIAGGFSAQILQNTNLGSSKQLASLFSKLLMDNAELEGLNAEYEQIKLNELRLQDELKILAREAAELDRLEREFQRAEAVYNSAAARLELNQSDIYASYPIVQLLAAPSMALNPISPNPMIALLAIIAALVLLNCGGVLLWQRQAIIQFLLKKN